ncbi:uncharacterized protein [Spinacia oleracea]|uniref:Reverse transcriptase domain-containing protein n=1 Tax=Spinacia oleracea TaxID=3562 RepID=A0ABM3QY90_SPIOL|nr:uncharacterized protein LOC130463269 [Spinacia oleracea]
MSSYVDEILCDVIPMDACHILLGLSWKFDRDVVHKGRSNEYELRDKGKKIMLKPISSQAVRSMSTKEKKRPNLTMLASEREIEQNLDHGEEVYFLVAKEDSTKDQTSREDIPINELLFEYKYVFPDDLPPGASLHYKAAYRCNPEETKELHKKIDELVSRGYVRESLSPCVVPVFLVPKKD